MAIKTKLFLSIIILSFTLSTTSQLAWATTVKTTTPENRVASILISQDFINEQLSVHSKSELVKEMKIALDPDHGQFFLRGKIQVPVEELRAVNLDPKLGEFRFQVTVKPKTTAQGHLILDFPLNETFFYPTQSKDPAHERVIVPVQLLSLALASVRGYLAALSGDFSGFDRRTEKLTALVKALDHAIATEKNADAREELKNQRESLQLQLAAVPIERKQLQTLSKEVESILGFTGEKELNINDELGAYKNALILKIKLSQLAPYLKGMDFGGVRVLQNYLAIDVNSTLAVHSPAAASTVPTARTKMKVAPSIILRLNQSLFESTEVVDAEKKEMSSKLRNLSFNLMDDGLHVAGDYKTFLFFSVHFETIVDFASTATDVFEIKVRDIKVAGIDFEFMAKFVLESLKKRLDQALKGICKFDDVREEKDHSRALQVTLDPKSLIPAFPDLHLVDIDIRSQEFLLKVGRPH